MLKVSEEEPISNKICNKNYDIHSRYIILINHPRQQYMYQIEIRTKKCVIKQSQRRFGL